jgi:hypothetical protein
VIESFLLGVVAATSFIAGLFFLKFWKQTHDELFLSFAIAFLVEGLNRCAILFVDKPNEGSPFTYIVRLFAFLLILGSILRKNYGSA